MKHGPSLSYYAHTYGSKGDVPLDTMDQAQWTVFCGATGGANATYRRNGVNVKYGEGAAESVPMGFSLGFLDDAPYSWSVSDVIAWDRPLSKEEIAGQGGVEDKLMKRKNALMRGDVLMARQSDMANTAATVNMYAAKAADARMQVRSNPHPKEQNWLMWEVKWADTQNRLALASRNPVGWILGGSGLSCDDACAQAGLRCSDFSLGMLYHNPDVVQEKFRVAYAKRGCEEVRKADCEGLDCYHMGVPYINRAHRIERRLRNAKYQCWTNDPPSPCWVQPKPSRNRLCPCELVSSTTNLGLGKGIT